VDGSFDGKGEDGGGLLGLEMRRMFESERGGWRVGVLIDKRGGRWRVERFVEQCWREYTGFCEGNEASKVGEVRWEGDYSDQFEMLGSWVCLYPKHFDVSVYLGPPRYENLHARLLAMYLFSFVIATQIQF
jgi:hypothetical protein